MTSDRRLIRLLSAATLLIVTWAPASLLCGEETSPDPPPLNPRDSLSAIELTDGFAVELVAAEPFVADPVAIDWGPDKKLWVAEMADYPKGTDGKGKAGGRIRFLEDTDDDGRYDRSTVFLEGVNFPTGVMAWKRGVLVTAAPEIFYAEDTTGDGKADHREVLYSGFITANQQLRVNGLRYGLDNWIYCASGAHTPDFGKDRGIHSVKLDKTIPLGSRDFRIRPDTGELDPQSGPSQYGRVRDDWGNWFGVQNAHPLWHYALKDQYQRRNPHYASPDARVEVIAGEAPRVYSAKTPQKRFHSFRFSNRFTSACGISIYRDELLYPRGTEQHGFTCEPFHNLVHHSVIKPVGVTFQGQRAENELMSELFASRDRWCRPVMTRTGPDGELWVVDMYRYMIEHPQFLGDEGRKELAPHYRAGEGLGRIYRVHRKGNRPRAWPRIDKLDANRLVETLAHPNGIVRDLAQRELIERDDKEALPLLTAALSSESRLARLHALCTLSAIDELDTKLLTLAIKDDEPAVRRQAIRIAAEMLQRRELVDTDKEALAKVVMAGRRDKDAKVHQEYASALGSLPDSETTQGIAQELYAARKEPYLTAAYMASIRPDTIERIIQEPVAVNLDDLLESNEQARERKASLGEDYNHALLRMAVSMGKDSEALKKLRNAVRPRLSRNYSLRMAATILDAFAERGDNVREMLEGEDLSNFDAIIAGAALIATDEKWPIDQRAGAVALMLRSEAHRKQDISAAVFLLHPKTPLDIQAALIDRLATQNDAEIAGRILAAWPEYGPAARTALLHHIPSNAAWVKALLDQIDQGNLARSDIPVRTLQKLRWSADPAIGKRVRALLKTINDNRTHVIDRYQRALQLPGDIARGRAVFTNKCATCHRDVDEKGNQFGHDVGPNLAAITDMSPQGLLRSVLDPNAAVEPKFVTYNAVTNDGRNFSGILATESSTSVTLREAEGKEQRLLRKDIDTLQSTGRSLMPEGLEKELSQQDVADLIAFVSRPRGRTPRTDD